MFTIIEEVIIDMNIIKFLSIQWIIKKAYWTRIDSHVINILSKTFHNYYAVWNILLLLNVHLSMRTRFLVKTLTNKSDLLEAAITDNWTVEVLIVDWRYYRAYSLPLHPLSLSLEDGNITGKVSRSLNVSVGWKYIMDVYWLSFMVIIYFLKCQFIDCIGAECPHITIS